MIIAIFTPHGGCPERCGFCDQKVSGGNPVSIKDITATIESHLRTSSSSVADEIAFFGGTFTAMPPDRQLAYLEAAKPYLVDGRIASARISTRPDAINEHWLKRLRDEYRVATVELGVQSFEKEPLGRLGRTHTLDHTINAVAVLKRLGLRTSLHLMLGCPGESATADQVTVARLSELKPDFVRIHPLLVLKGTALAAEWENKTFEPLALESAIERAAWLVEALEATGIRVIRLGLQPNELLEEAVLAGPYHPAFGELVRGRILRNRVSQQLTLASCPAGASVELEANGSTAGYLKGKEKTNLTWLKGRFLLSTIEVRVVKNGSDGEVKIRIHHSDRAAQCRQIELAQQAGGGAARDRHPEGPNHLAAAARLHRAT